MSKVKYQIFVSSTYDDLKEERDQVIKACLEMGHIPVGMEMFSAADEEQWQIITRQIDESDYYVIIIANRYGSMVDGISYTEKEYDYAIANRVPTLGFVLDSLAAWPVNRAENSEAGRTKLEAFKQKVKGKPVNFWTSKEDLHGKCAVALMKTFNTQPRPGWVRSPDSIGPEVASELSRLSSENAKLTEQLVELRKSPDTSDLVQGDDNVGLKFRIFSHVGTSVFVEISRTWNSIFYKIAEFSIKNPVEGVIMDELNSAYGKEVLMIGYQREGDEYSFDNYVRLSNVYLEAEYFDMIRIQLLALNLIHLANRDGLNIWTLTSQGQQQYVNAIAKRKMKE